MSTKTSFIYTIAIFYSIILLFTTLSGNLILKGDVNIPKANFQDSTTSNNNDYCASGLPDSESGFSLKRLLIPSYLRPNCVVQKTNEYSNNYVDDLEGGDKFGFIPSMITGFTYTPTWINAIIFTPLIITLLYLIITTIGGAIFDGGS